MNDQIYSDCLLFLDFDGVICNSVHECFVSSWIAWYGAEHPPDSVSIEQYRRFVSYRPFIRRGGDYLILQKCVDQDIELEAQCDFDDVEASLGERQSDEFHARFYAAREYLLERYPGYWLQLNPLYPGLATHLEALAGRHYILTTKKSDFACRILEHHGVLWPVERIICSGKRRKSDVIGEFLDREHTECGVLIDDQLDHFTGKVDPRIRGFLASWGYVKPDWLRTDVVPVISIDEGVEILRRFL